jgi:hypothetical protein
MRLEMSKWFITTTRRFTEEIKVESKLREDNDPWSSVMTEEFGTLKEVCGALRNTTEFHVDVVTI